MATGQTDDAIPKLRFSSQVTLVLVNLTVSECLVGHSLWASTEIDLTSSSTDFILKNMNPLLHLLIFKGFPMPIFPTYSLLHVFTLYTQTTLNPKPQHQPGNSSIALLCILLIASYSSLFSLPKT